MSVNGYIRQASSDIQPGLSINSADFNNEFNAIQTAFDNSVGHDHSGNATGSGQKISLTSSVTGVLPQANGGTGTNSIGTSTQLLHGGGSPAFSAVVLTTDVSGTLPVANGGTGITSIGAATTVLHGGASTPSYSAVVLTTDVSGTLPVANGGVGAATLTANAVLLGAGTGAVQFATIGTAGNLLIDQGAATNPAFEAMSGDATLAATGAITVTKTSGTVFATSATTDTTNAANISSGTLAAARGGAGTITGILKANGSGVVSQAVNGTDYVSASLLQGYIGGLTLFNDGSSPTTVLDITAGVAMDGTNSILIGLGAFTKSTGGSWAAGSGSNGMGNGITVGNNTWYHVILANNGGSPDVYFDTSISGGNRPAGISDTKVRRIGSFKTDGSARILTFVQNGDEFLWLATVLDQNALSLSTTAALMTLSTPLGVKTNALMRVTLSAAAAYVLINSPDETSIAGGAIGVNANAYATTTAVPSYQLNVRTNTSSQVRIVSSINANAATVYTYGYIDTRGRFI